LLQLTKLVRSLIILFLLDRSLQGNLLLMQLIAPMCQSSSFCDLEPYANAFVRFICGKESILEQSDLSFFAEAFHNKHHCSHGDILKIESALKDHSSSICFCSVESHPV
jgi:hypothetical protein